MKNSFYLYRACAEIKFFEGNRRGIDKGDITTTEYDGVFKLEENEVSLLREASPNKDLSNFERYEWTKGDIRPYVWEVYPGIFQRKDFQGEKIDPRDYGCSTRKEFLKKVLGFRESGGLSE